MAFKQVREQSLRTAREAGQLMRSRLLQAAAQHFARDGLAAVSVAQVAADAGAHASQVSYYFGSKESLFVEAACREVLHTAERAELAAQRARSLQGYREALVREVVPSAALQLFVQALVLGRHQPSLSPLLARTMERLHHEGARAHAEMFRRRGWPLPEAAEQTARYFWSLVLGVALRDSALGISTTVSEAEVSRHLARDSPVHQPVRSASSRLRLAQTKPPLRRAG